MTEPNRPAGATKPEPTGPAEPVQSASTATDEMGHASFPASDPPAVWTWEVKQG
ncbi:MAG TPA: hypothetical protein VFL77_05235 [Solirubrobacterales bacterium]|nr:hypothetical protein [Solirubrobacterales bacterium]